MIVSGAIKYFKSLSVGSGIESSIRGLFSGMPKKTTLIYVGDDSNFGNNKTLELDATLEFNLSMETRVLETPAENQQVYSNGALKQPKIITVRCYVELDKMRQLEEIHNNITPLWIVCDKPIPSTMNQRGYYTDSSMYCLQVISITNEGYDNCVACSLTFREIFLFDYSAEYIYDTKKNKINKGNTNKAIHVAPQDKPWGHTLVSWLGFGLKEIFYHNLGGGK